MKFAISVGHGKYVRGASGLIDEVDEAVRVVAAVANWLSIGNHDVVTFFDTSSTTQDQNLHAIVNWHNDQERDLDCSIHFNAYIPTDGGRGTEVLYLTQEDVAAKVAQAISSASGLINRGAQKRSDLYFLNKTDRPSILIEVCFVDAKADVEQYQEHFDPICEAIANVAPHPEEFDRQTLYAMGKVSWFGGPDDMGVSPAEGLALENEGVNPIDKPELFLDENPPGTTGNARRLDPNSFYCALRWDYDQFSKARLAGDEVALIRSPRTGKSAEAHPADWGPHTDTGRVADVSPAILTILGITTDDEVEVIYPSRRES